MYEFFSHTADLGLRVRAATLDELFADAARGLTAMLVANVDDVRPLDEQRLVIDGENLEYLLFDWLSELLFTFETSGLLFCEFDVRVSNRHLEAVCRGEPAEPGRHKMEHEVKAITYHGLRVEQENGAWLAELIVDI
ncbi:MAG: archease [Pirellulales bacterium]